MTTMRCFTFEPGHGPLQVSSGGGGVTVPASVAGGVSPDLLLHAPKSAAESDERATKDVVRFTRVSSHECHLFDTNGRPSGA